MPYGLRDTLIKQILVTGKTIIVEYYNHTVDIQFLRVYMIFNSLTSFPKRIFSSVILNVYSCHLNVHV